jgi:hypothetical protein
MKGKKERADGQQPSFLNLNTAPIEILKLPKVGLAGFQTPL